MFGCTMLYSYSQIKCYDSELIKKKKIIMSNKKWGSLIFQPQLPLILPKLFPQSISLEFLKIVLPHAFHGSIDSY